MRIIGTVKAFFLTGFVLMCVISTGAIGQEKQERAKLLEQQKLLDSRIAALNREQDFLIFQKILFDSDSKYLIIRLSERTGQLKYKNRVLKDFHFSCTNGGKIKQGMARLTGKSQSSTHFKSLTFENSVIIQSKRSSYRRHGDAPRLFLTDKAFRSIFYAVEDGAPAYFLP